MPHRLPDLGPVTLDTVSPPLPNARRKGSIGGSTIQLVCDEKTHEDAARRIFQFDNQQWNRLFVFYTTLGVKNEAPSALHGQELIDDDEGSHSEILYAAPAADDELPFAYVCPDVILRRPGKHDVTAQIKFKAAKAGCSDWTYHRVSCIRKKQHQTHACECPPPSFHVDQLFWEAKVSKVMANYLIASSKLDGKGKTEFLPIRQTHYLPWWRDRRPHVVLFYDRYLRWYWEGDRSPEATYYIRELVRTHNEATQMAAVEAAMTADLDERAELLAKAKRAMIDIDALLRSRPESDADMEKCRKWTRMRRRTAEHAKVAGATTRLLSSLLLSDPAQQRIEAVEEFGLLWMSTLRKNQRLLQQTAVGGKRKREEE